ncbi:MAG: thymidylate synthase complementing protein [crAssphage sp. isolate ctcc615]|uniref:Thymidylate synthase complementing protein n=1 Tax=crAssphage sp. isolate ctcc615 TaxID=2989853 RepID=A0A345BP42_9CAUD|nr:MAG: thymidylate synthase complementing protein [crAssphage sp. isolate ctcc615]AXF52213.1 MAG: thymidylate synthase complementing protein [crAssphage sp. isolate ctcc615]
MEIIDPSVKVWLNHNTIDHIARCARVCYASDKTTANDKMCEALWKNNHRSMFRHAGVYYIIPEKIQIPETAYIGADVKLVGHHTYVSANEQSAREYWDRRYKQYRVSYDVAKNTEVFCVYKMLRYTLCIETGIDITREFNRKSPNSIAEQSTRYVDFNKKVGIRFKKCHWMNKCNLYRKILYKFMAKTAEWFYKLSRSKYGLNLPPQDARWILPLDTMSKVVYTYTVAEWEYIINMRLWDYTGKAHPDAKLIGKLIYDEFNKYGEEIINYKEELDKL